MTQVLSRQTSSPTGDHPRYFKLFRPYSLQNLNIWLIPTKANLSGLATQNILKANQSVQMFSITLTMIHKESSFNVKPTKILSDLRRISCHGRNYSQPYFFKRNQSSDNRSHGFGATFLLKKLSASDFSYERNSAFRWKRPTGLIHLHSRV